MNFAHASNRVKQPHNSNYEKMRGAPALIRKGRVNSHYKRPFCMCVCKVPKVSMHIIRFCEKRKKNNLVCSKELVCSLVLSDLKKITSFLSAACSSGETIEFVVWVSEGRTGDRLVFGFHNEELQGAGGKASVTLES